MVPLHLDSWWVISVLDVELSIWILDGVLPNCDWKSVYSDSHDRIDNAWLSAEIHRGCSAN